MTSSSTASGSPATPLREEPTDEFIEAFLANMPETYRIHYSEADVRLHAGIAWRRGSTLAHIEQWPAAAKDTTWLCVVTDDRPGLLAMLCAAITAHSLNILTAKIHCRTDRKEAIDFFCVRPLKSDGRLRVSASDLASIGATITALLEGKTDVPTLERRSHPTSRPGERPETSVYFDGERDGADLLIVESDDRAGLLGLITNTLSSLGVWIAWSDVVTMAGRARDEFHLLERNGTHLSTKRQQAVVAQVATAISSLHDLHFPSSTPPPPSTT